MPTDNKQMNYQTDDKLDMLAIVRLYIYFFESVKRLLSGKFNEKCTKNRSVSSNHSFIYLLGIIHI